MKNTPFTDLFCFIFIILLAALVHSVDSAWNEKIKQYEIHVQRQKQQARLDEEYAKYGEYQIDLNILNKVKQLQDAHTNVPSITSEEI